MTTRHSTPVPINAIAAYYGVTRPAIRKWCQETGVKMHKVGNTGAVYIDPADIPADSDRWKKR